MQRAAVMGRALGVTGRRAQPLASRPPKPAERPRMRRRSVLAGAEARAALLRGIVTMAALVRPTLGPTARTVAIAPLAGADPPEVLDRAAIILRRTIEIEGSFENMGAMLLRHLVWCVHEGVGDGGATAAVFASRLIEGAMNYAGAGGDPLALRRGIDRAAAEAQAELCRLARPIELPSEIASVIASSIQDEAVSLLIGEALEAVGPDGVLLVRDALGAGTQCEYVDGVRWNEGCASSYLLGDDQLMTTLDEPLILVADFDLSSASEIVPAIECTSAEERPLMIVAPGFNDVVLAVLVSNRERGLLAVKAPTPVGQKERAIEEMALLTGARLFRQARGDRLAEVHRRDLGSARQGWATKGMSGVLGGRGDRAAVRERLAEVRLELERAQDEDARGKLRERIGRLSGISAIVRVGAQTKGEQKELQQRVEAAVASGRAAFRGGVVPGGGGSLIAAARAVRELDLSGDEQVGARLFARALEEPARVIAANAGLDEAPIVNDAYRLAPDRVFDAIRGQWVEPWESGLLDAYLVLRQVIETSVSAAVTTLMTGTLVRGPAPARATTP